MQIHVQMFSNESCDAQLEHQDFEISPPSAVEKKCVFLSAFNMSVAIGRLSEKRANKLFKKKKKAKKGVRICLSYVECVT